jgi:MFS family permease
MVKKPKGMVAFTIIWSGQMVSFLGSAMTSFALLIWVWITTHQATPTVLMAFFTFIPLLVMTPIAGAFVDRWDRKKAMILSDLIAGLGSVAILILYLLDALEVWHLYIVGLFVGAFSAFQWPAFSAAITMLVEKKHYARADALMGVAQSFSGILGPPLAAVMLVTIGIPGILVLDIITFCYAIGVLLIMHIPSPPKTEEPAPGFKSIWRDSAFGFRWIYRRRPLLLLTLTFFMFNLVAGFGMTIIAPMVLARTGDNEILLGGLMSVLGIGGLAGGITLAIWGGPKRRIYGLLGGGMMTVIAGIGVLPTNPIFWALGGLIITFVFPTVNGCSQAIWQSKTPPQMQGRVFGARRFIAQISNVFPLIMVGPLVDYVFEPAMDVGGGLAGTLGWMIEPGPGAGMTLIIFIAFTLATVVSAVAFLNRDLRNIEDLIPDHDEKEGEEDDDEGEIEEQVPDDGEDRKDRQED